MIDWGAVVNGPVMGVFGELVQYRPVAGMPFTVSSTFHEAYNSVTVADGIAITTESPALGVNLSDFPVPPRQKDEVTITATALHAGGVYAVKEVQKNGVGAAILLLNHVRF